MFQLATVKGSARPMVGTSKHRKLKLKAMETWGVALFLADFLPRHIANLDEKGRLISDCGSLLIRFLKGLKYFGPLPTESNVQHLLSLWKVFLIKSGPLEIRFPKIHLMVHMIKRILKQGNPCTYQCFLDESLNRTLKNVLRLVHQSNFERLGLVKANEALSRPSMRQRLC